LGQGRLKARSVALHWFTHGTGLCIANNNAESTSNVDGKSVSPSQVEMINE